MSARIMSVAIGDVDPNPHRLTGEYPYNPDKLAALKRSIQEVGLWEGIMGRQNGNRVEIAFGHHRHKAALESGMSHIPVIIRDLDDRQMLMMMGRENLEEYNASFPVMLE